MSTVPSAAASRVAINALTCALCLVLVPHPSRAADVELTPALDDALIAVIATKVAPAPAAVGRFRMSTWREAELPNDRTIRSEVRTEFLLLDSGLWGTSTEASTSGAVATSGQSASLQLCGLVELMQTSRSRQDTAMSLVIPIGKLFVPFGMQGTRDIDAGRRVSSFASDEPSLCAPRPGSRFEYRVTTDAVVQLGLRTVRTSTPRVVTCIVADRLDAVDDRVLGGGDVYLPVACETVGVAHSLTHLAYLPEYRYYVVLDASDGRVRERHVLSVD